MMVVDHTEHMEGAFQAFAAWEENQCMGEVLQGSLELPEG